MSQLSDTVKECFMLRDTIGDVGIEIEVEGNIKHIENDFWSTKGDGSLRNGAEYVLNYPVPMEKLPEALDSFKENF